MTADVRRSVSTLVFTDIPADQRAALAWRLRDVLAKADAHADGHAKDAGQEIELVRVEHLRGSLLGLIEELEGSRRRDISAASPRRSA
jgi:hypothetical protein